MNADQLIRRARSVIGAGCRYRLGKGGMDPTSRHPWNSRMQCDCSGFTSWALGFSRKVDDPFYVRHNGGWVNTDAMWTDAHEPVGMFRPIFRPTPGALVVYPGHGRGRYGHVGIIGSVSLDGATVSIIHCASTNDRVTGCAIAENDGGGLMENPKSRLIWYEGLETAAQSLIRSARHFG